MLYRDPLYGIHLLTPAIQRIIHTKEMVRLRNITQSVLPNCLLIDGPVPSRFQHSIGSCILAHEVIRNNPQFPFAPLLPVATLLHDAGNSGLSHLGEHFLEEITGKNGESFLADVLDGSETERILKELGFSVQEIVRFVTGTAKPFSDVLHGSVDIDNLDNVGRYNAAVRAGGPSFDALLIAGSFRFRDGEWTLLERSRPETEKWQAARAAVYGAIYHKRHLSPVMMVYRAMEIAFTRGELTKEVFFHDDMGMIEHLTAHTNPKTSYLIERALRWDWYDEVVNLAWREPPREIEQLAQAWTGRKTVADFLCRTLDVPEERVCAYIGKGKDNRKIAVPFLKKDGVRTNDEKDDTPIYRLKVYIPPERAESERTIARITDAIRQEFF